LGFRQLAAERWSAAPLYTITVVDKKLSEALASEGRVLKVRLQAKRNSANPAEGTERFIIAGVESDTGSVSSRALKLQLNTLSDAGLGESQYWLDSGSVFR
ncbi:MAG: virulence factor SrfB, partial [Pseudomonadota bacterium]